MSFLQQIRDALVDEKSDLNSVLLELRLLEAKLGSDILEEWVKLESECYPEEIEVPSYRVVNVSYIGVFTKDGNEPKKGLNSYLFINVILEWKNDDQQKQKRFYGE